MNAIGIIPARGGSKGLPGKNIKMLFGKPMIAWIIEAALEAETLKKVIVSTDSDDIAEISRHYGAEVIMRPPEIAGDEAAIEDSLRHVVTTLETQQDFHPDIVVMMQANVPVRKPGFIDEVVRKLDQSQHSAVVSVFSVNQRPEWMKKVEDGKLVPYMHCEVYRRQQLPELFLLDGAVEALRRETLMATAGRSGVHLYMGDNVGFCAEERIYSMDVDSIEDFDIAEAALRCVGTNRGGGER